MYRHSCRPHPLVRKIKGDFQSIIGIETKQQILEKEGRLPDSLVACIGEDQMQIIFFPFLDKDVKMFGVEAGENKVFNKMGACSFINWR